MNDATSTASKPRLPMVALTGAVHDKCSRCTGLCCSYFAMPIDTPRSYDDFDDVRWYVAHQGVQVFKEGRTWYVQVATICTHLTPDRRCAIYETRPNICRKHSVESCEFENTDPFDYGEHFLSSADVASYMERRWPKGRPATAKRRRRSLPIGLTRR